MSKWYVYAITALLAFTAFYACWCRAPLIWDGAYQFDATLIQQHPFVYLTRFHTYFLWYPTVWASHFTQNMMVLQSIFGLPFLLAPAAAILFSWWIVRDHAPHLIIWPILGAAAGALPGQIFVINDSIFQLHMFWPVFMGLLAPLNWPKRIVLAMLALFQLVHPLGVPLLLGGAAAAAVLAKVNVQRRRQLIAAACLLGALGIMAIAKIEITNHITALNDTYARQEATWEMAKMRWAAAVWGAPFNGLLCVWAAGALMLAIAWRKNARRLFSFALSLLALLCVLRAGLYWIYRAHGPIENWGGSIDYRRWVGPLCAPFFAMAVLESLLQAKRSRRPSADRPIPATIRGIIGLIVACIFAITLSLECTTWNRLTTRLMACVRDYPSVIVPTDAPSLAWTKNTPLSHWSSVDYVIAIEGRQPDKLLLDPADALIMRSQSPPLKHWHLPPPGAPAGTDRWYNYDSFLRQLAAEKR